MESPSKFTAGRSVLKYLFKACPEYLLCALLYACAQCSGDDLKKDPASVFTKVVVWLGVNNYCMN